MKAANVKPSVSKSQYLKGLQCPKAIWYYRNRKDLAPEITPETQARFDAGNAIGQLAKQYFPEGVEVTNKYYDTPGAIKATEQYINEGHDIIFEATAMHPKDGSYCRIDILQKTPNSNQWDLIEVKCSTQVKDNHYDDLAFQYRVFIAAGYDIRKCKMMLVDNSYIRQGEIDPQQFFYFDDITSGVKQKQQELETNIVAIIAARNSDREPLATIGARCMSPYECDYKPHCWADVPPYSVYNAFTAKKADEIAQQYGTFDIRELPSDVLPEKLKAVDVESYLSGQPHADPSNVTRFLESLQYPLYFLDYETINPAVPLFDGTRPYQQVPFQFSLHRQDEPGGDLHHVGYLHKEKTDPRLEFVKNLLAACGDSGSIVVYYKSFEEGRNNDLATCFPEYAGELQAINARMVDLLIPFKQRMLYHPDQRGSASIKDVLPAFTSESYDDMAINSGNEASRAYEYFLRGNTTEAEQAQLWQNLEHYCKLDTKAMVMLLAVLRENSG